MHSKSIDGNSCLRESAIQLPYGRHFKAEMRLRIFELLSAIFCVLFWTCQSFSTFPRKFQQKSILAMGFFDSLFGGDKKSQSEGGIQPKEKIVVSAVADKVAAVKDRQANSLKGDNVDAALVRPLLAGTQLEFRAIQVSYRASKNGWNPAAFHKCVDNRGPAIVLATSSDGLVVGGYNPKGWAGSGANRPSIAAFLYVREKTSKPSDAVKLCKVGGADFAVGNDNQESGIYFGPDGLIIPLAAKPYGYPMIENNKMARSRLGSYYEKLPNSGKSVFAFGSGDRNGRLEGTLTEVLVFTGAYLDGETIPFAFPL